jgi:hypothetical protein
VAGLCHIWVEGWKAGGAWPSEVGNGKKKTYSSVGAMYSRTSNTCMIIQDPRRGKEGRRAKGEGMERKKERRKVGRPRGFLCSGKLIRSSGGQRRSPCPIYYLPLVPGP